MQVWPGLPCLSTASTMARRFCSAFPEVYSHLVKNVKRFDCHGITNMVCRDYVLDEDTQTITSAVVVMPIGDSSV